MSCLWWETGPQNRTSPTMMEQKRQALIRQACSERLAKEAIRDNLSLRERILSAASTVLTELGVRLKACCRGRKEQPHEYIAGPDDRVYT